MGPLFQCVSSDTDDGDAEHCGSTRERKLTLVNMSNHSAADNCEEFYRQRDSRSQEYSRENNWGHRPVIIVAETDVTSSVPGQLALLALANMASRVHRRITFVLSEASATLLAPAPLATQCTTIGDAIHKTASVIDPCGQFEITNRCPEYDPSTTLTLGLGGMRRSDLRWYIGAEQAIATLSRTPTEFGMSRESTRGASLAACFGAAALFREAIGRPVAQRRVSAWNFAEGEAAAPGPDYPRPLDIGKTLMVGAGAVGAALAYWIAAWGLAEFGCDWTIADGDVVTLHNTNRGMLFLPRDSDWFGQPPLNKAELLSSFISGSTALPGWFHEQPSLSSARFDVVLALANDYGVRATISSQNHPLVWQATTGENWMSQLHRHILGVDDCVYCRTGELKVSAFKCSGVEVKDGSGESNDAALPFLSAASGLMLLCALERLARDDTSILDGPNFWSWDFESGFRFTARPSIRKCRDGCGHLWGDEVRKKINARTRWAHLSQRK
jgi:hypothetical protein